MTDTRRDPVPSPLELLVHLRPKTNDEEDPSAMGPERNLVEIHLKDGVLTSGGKMTTLQVPEGKEERREGEER